MRTNVWFKKRYPDELFHYCCYCGEQTFHEDLTREHLVPRSIGGNGTVHNLKPCCKSCNKRRGNVRLEDWLVHLKKRHQYLKGKTHSQFHVYRLEAMIENVEHWIDYIEENKSKLYVVRNKTL